MTLGASKIRHLEQAGSCPLPNFQRKMFRWGGIPLAPAVCMRVLTNFAVMRSTSGFGSRSLDSRAEQRGLDWVLLIDDDPMGVRALSRWIKGEFATETRSASTIQQAEGWLRTMPKPVAIITDFDLAAGETGVGALKHFRAAGVTAPAAVLTGAPTRARAALGTLRLGKVPVLSKAGFHEQLRRWLAVQLGSGGRRRVASAR